MADRTFDCAVERLLNALPDNEQKLTESMQLVRAKYIETDWDDKLSQQFNTLLRNVVTKRTHDGSASEMRRETRALILVGEAGTGKSESLEHMFTNHPALPGYGIMGSGCPLVSVTVPAPCTLKTLGMRITEYLLLSKRTRQVFDTEAGSE